MLTYVFVLQQAGTIDSIGEAVTGLGAPLLIALLLCYIGGVVSAFASSTAIIGVAIALAVPFLQAGDIGAVGVVVALSVSSTIVDVSPFSTNGALVLANAQDVDQDRFYKQILGYADRRRRRAVPGLAGVRRRPGWLCTDRNGAPHARTIGRRPRRRPDPRPGRAARRR